MLLERITLQNFGIYRDENIFDLTSTKEKPIILVALLDIVKPADSAAPQNASKIATPSKSN